MSRKNGMDLSANEPLFWSINFFLNINFLGSQFLSPPVKKSVDQDRHRNKNFPKRRKNFGHRFQHRNKTKTPKNDHSGWLETSLGERKKIVETGICKKTTQNFFLFLTCNCNGEKDCPQVHLVCFDFFGGKKKISWRQLCVVMLLKWMRVCVSAYASVRIWSRR